MPVDLNVHSRYTQIILRDTWEKDRKGAGKSWRSWQTMQVWPQVKEGRLGESMWACLVPEEDSARPVASPWARMNHLSSLLPPKVGSLKIGSLSCFIIGCKQPMGSAAMDIDPGGWSPWPALPFLKLPGPVQGRVKPVFFSELKCSFSFWRRMLPPHPSSCLKDVTLSLLSPIDYQIHLSKGSVSSLQHLQISLIIMIKREKKLLSVPSSPIPSGDSSFFLLVQPRTLVNF